MSRCLYCPREKIRSDEINFCLAKNSGMKVYSFTLAHGILGDSSTVICWMSPFVILGVSGLFCHFYSFFDGNCCW